MSPEAYDGDGPRWVVKRAEAELVERYGQLDDSELGLTAAMFEPPDGIFLVARSVDVRTAGRRRRRAPRGGRTGRGEAPLGRPGLATAGASAGA